MIVLDSLQECCKHISSTEGELIGFLPRMRGNSRGKGSRLVVSGLTLSWGIIKTTANKGRGKKAKGERQGYLCSGEGSWRVMV